MSLKAFHIAFILLSILLALGFGNWAIRDFLTSQNRLYQGMGIASFIAGIFLVVYLIWFLTKMKRIGRS